MPMIRYFVGSLLPVIKHADMRMLSYFYSVQFRSNHRGLSSKCCETVMTERGRCLSNEDEVTQHVKFFELGLQLLLILDNSVALTYKMTISVR